MLSLNITIHYFIFNKDDVSYCSNMYKLKKYSQKIEILIAPSLIE